MNWKVYKFLNKDLAKKGLKTEKDYKNHYKNKGIKENRKSNIYDIYPDFNLDNYRYNYDDLNKLSNNDLELHWLKHGVSEKRIYDKKIKKVYFISNIKKGGSVKYIQDIISGFPQNNYIIIRNKNELFKRKFMEGELVLLQQLLKTNINPEDIIKIKLEKKIKLIMCIHDFCWLSDKNPHNSYLNTVCINPKIKELIELCDEVIFPTNFIFDVYSKFCNKNNFKLVPHNDIKLDNNKINIPKILNNTINVGFLNYFTEVKGSEYVLKLMEIIKTHKKYKIKYHVVDKTMKPYKEHEYFKLLKKLNIHCLLYLNKWGETWCYSLSKGLNSGLPILYNNFGAFKERIMNKEHYFKVFENENESTNCGKLLNRFRMMLDYIINNNGKEQGMNEDLKIEYNDYYKNLLN